MELTIEQALQQGVAAHKDGKLQEAERLYRSILQSQPEHPDANHNLGVLAVSVNKADVALPLFKSALAANPKIEQFWLSYIDALIKEQQFDNAKKVLEQAKNQGVDADRLNSLEAQLSPKTQIENVNSASPSQQQLSNLLEHYQAGRLDDAEKLATSISQEFPEHPFSWKVLGAVLKQTGRISESFSAMKKSVYLEPHDAEAHYSFGDTLQELGRLEEAEASYTQAIALKPDYAEAHYKLGNTLQKLDRLDEAEASYRQAIVHKPDYTKALSNLGATLQSFRRYDEAEASYTQAITLKPDFAEAHYNLGNIHKELGRLGEAEASYRQAIEHKPDFAEAHNNLGVRLKELGKLNEAEVSYTQAIALNPFYAEAHSNLGVILHMNGDIDFGLESLERANNIDPDLHDNQIILAILKARKALGRTELNADNIGNLGSSSEHFPPPVILNRPIEAQLIDSLYKMKPIELEYFDNSRSSDARFGTGKCSRDFKLFKDDSPIIKSVAEDLTIIMREVVKSDIYIAESFFNILGTGGGTAPHKHLSPLDKDEYLNFRKQKYSLVYYLSVGDQNCIDPGILKLCDPSVEILPSEGMIAIFPADRQHSAIYGGKKDRVMIGVNFYSL